MILICLSVTVLYFALLREQCGVPDETVVTSADTPAQLYEELQQRHGFTLTPAALRVAVNDQFQSWDTPLRDSDRVVFIQPVGGG